MDLPPPVFFDDPHLLAPRQTLRTDLGGGVFTLRHPDALEPYARCVGDWLEHWAAATPHAPAFSEPQVGGWRTLDWAGLRAQVGSAAQALLNLKLPAEKPVVVLSDNALDHLVLLLAGMHIGRAVCTVSSAYSRLAQGDYGRLHAILAVLDPALVYASSTEPCARALVGVVPQAVRVFSQGAAEVPGALDFADLLRTVETPAVMQAFERITPDTHAKYLLTSGSTGTPKVVINTHRMLCANQQMLAQTLRFLTIEKPVLLDWLPWSHTFGGNHNLNMVLMHGGTLHIDDGRPMPGAIDRSIHHLRSVQPTVYFNVPRGYDMLLPTLEQDEAFARHFFGRMRMAFYAGAGMPVSTWRRLEQVARGVREEPLWLTTSWGSTETAPANTFANWPLDCPGVIGLPMPGAEVKFVPNGDKLEMRVRGDHIFPGYRHNPTATTAAFDADGYYCIGDAGSLRDPTDALQGIVFDGRVAEDFKVNSGTWVSVGALRLRLVSALSPWVMDAVITGHDRNEVGALLFISEAGRALAPQTLAAHVRAGLQALRAEGGGSSQTPSRVGLLAGAPDAGAGEITDKGYLNQRLVLQRRVRDVEQLYAEPLSPDVITP